MAPPKFHLVPTWGRLDRELSKDGKILRAYLQRCPMRASEGLFEVSVGHIRVDTNLTNVEIDQAFTELSAPGLAEYDIDNEVALDRTALKTNPLRNPRDKETGERIVDEGTGKPKVDKRIPNAIKLFAQIPESLLKHKFVVLADFFSPDLADAIRKDSTYAYPPSPSEAPSEPHGRTE